MGLCRIHGAAAAEAKNEIAAVFLCEIYAAHDLVQRRIGEDFVVEDMLHPCLIELLFGAGKVAVSAHGPSAADDDAGLLSREPVLPEVVELAETEVEAGGDVVHEASGETVKVTVVFQAVLCGGEDGFRSEGTQREGSDAEAAALQKIPAGKDVVHKKLLMMPCGPGRIV